MGNYNWNSVASAVTSNILGGEWPCIVFVQTVQHAELLAGAISEKLSKKISIVHGGIPQRERERLAMLMRKRDPNTPVVVSAKIWSTGIDIPCLQSIYNCGVKYAVVGLLQQAGRSGRISADKSSCNVYEMYSDGEEQSLDCRLGAYKAAGYNVASTPPPMTPLQRMLLSQAVKPAKGRQLVLEKEPPVLRYLLLLAIREIMTPAVWALITAVVAISLCTGSSS